MQIAPIIPNDSQEIPMTSAPLLAAASPTDPAPFSQAIGLETSCQQSVARAAGIADVPLVVRPRWTEFAARVGDPGELLAAFQAMPPGTMPGSAAWVAPLSEIGDRHVARATRAADAGDRAGAAEFYRKAAGFYFVARFPAALGPAAEAAYAKSIAATEAGGRLLDPPLKIVRIPYEGQAIVAHLRVPAGVDAPPVVILSGGVDTWKGELGDPVNALLAEGLATVVVDMPGTGENRWMPAAPGAERLFVAVITTLQARTDLDGRHIGFYGLSFGGYWAVRLALAEPAITAAVSVGGPISTSFEPAWSAGIQDGTRLAIAAAMTRDPGAVTRDEFNARLAALSLERQGLLANPAGNVALLYINGALDTLVNPADAAVVPAAGLAQDTLIFADDRHTASANTTLYLPFAARWLREHL